MDQDAGHLQHVKGVLVADVLNCKWLQQRNCEVSGRCQRRTLCWAILTANLVRTDKERKHDREWRQGR